MLKGLARCLTASVHRPRDLACCVGGEEFALLLPDTDKAGALRVAREIHAHVSAPAIPHAGTGAGGVMVSVGVLRYRGRGRPLRASRCIPLRGQDRRAEPHPMRARRSLASPTGAPIRDGRGLKLRVGRAAAWMMTVSLHPILPSAALSVYVFARMLDMLSGFAEVESSAARAAAPMCHADLVAAAAHH